MSEDRNALHRVKQVHGKAVGVFFLPECPKLAFDPGQVLSEDLVRQVHGRANQPRSFVDRCSSHVAGEVSQLTQYDRR